MYKQTITVLKTDINEWDQEVNDTVIGINVSLAQYPLVF